jgi:hypothetical protein
MTRSHEDAALLRISTLGSHVAVSGQSLMAASGQILLSAHSGLGACMTNGVSKRAPDPEKTSKEIAKRCRKVRHWFVAGTFPV